MPIFEFTCETCDALGTGNAGRRFSALVGVVANAAPPRCPRCGGAALKRAVSRFARVRSEDDALESLAERADSLDENDPGAMRSLMREMAGQMGEDMDGDDFEQMIDEAEAEESNAGGVAADDAAAPGED